MQPSFSLTKGIVRYSRALQKKNPSDHALMTMWGRYRCTPSSLPSICGDNGQYIQAKDFEQVINNNMANSRQVFNYMFKTTFHFASKAVKIDERDYRELLKLIYDPNLLGCSMYSERTYDSFDMRSMMGGKHAHSVFQAQFQNTPKENALAFLSAVDSQFDDFKVYIDAFSMQTNEQAVHVAVRTGSSYLIFMRALKDGVNGRE